MYWNKNYLHRKASHVRQFHQIRILMFNGSKESIITLWYGISIITKWVYRKHNQLQKNVSFLKKRMDLLSWWWNCSASWIRRRPDSTRFQQSKLFSKFENNTKIKKKTSIKQIESKKQFQIYLIREWIT